MIFDRHRDLHFTQRLDWVSFITCGTVIKIKEWPPSTLILFLYSDVIKEQKEGTILLIKLLFEFITQHKRFFDIKRTLYGHPAYKSIQPGVTNDSQ